MKRVAAAILLAIAVAALVFELLQPEGVPLEAAVDGGPSARRDGATAIAQQVPGEAPAARALFRPELETPEAAVGAAVRAIEAGDLSAFSETLLPAIRAEVTPEVLARCRARIASTRVLPDWETAEETAEDGHPVRKVSMFGKSLTGFHRIDGRWLADRVWCLPSGLP